MLKDIIAACGYDCSECPAYKATHSDDAAEKVRIAEKWSKTIGKTMTVEEILCDGCRTGGRLVAFCATCNIKTCAQAKGYPTCAHCPECPCEKIVKRGTREMLAALKKTL
jgi:hypothetical protein